MQIDCELCPYRDGEAPCEECLVTIVLQLEDGSMVIDEDGREADEPAVLDAAQARAIRVLAEAGLLQPLPVRREEAG